jgi:hypothetical protein
LSEAGFEPLRRPFRSDVGAAVEIWKRGPAGTTSPVFRLRQDKLSVDAQAQQIDGEFTMLAGSIVVAQWHGGEAESTQKAYAAYRAQHQHLLVDGAIVVENGQGTLGAGRSL